MKIVCSCGNTLNIIRTEDGYDEGWYCKTEGNIDLVAEHNFLRLYCPNCEQDNWIFT